MQECAPWLKLFSTVRADSPVSVSNAVLKIDESLTVHPQKVSAVEVRVSFHKHVIEFLLLRLLLVLGIAIKRSLGFNFGHQQSSLSYAEADGQEGVLGGISRNP